MTARPAERAEEPARIVVARLTGAPAGSLGALIAESEGEGLRFVRRLADEWASGANRFDRPGETLLVAMLGGRLVGVCGLNVDPYTARAGVGRVRHLYVLTAYRRHGIGARLVSEIVGAARDRFHTLRLTTRDPAAARLYERLGFSPVAGAADCTHALGVAARPQPRLETERLVMRMFREDDFEAYARIFGDPEVARYLGDGRPLERWEAWRSMVFHLGHWSLRGYGMWAVEEKATGALVGRVGFLYPEGWPGLELAWGLGHAWWGKGYATESARRALAWGFAELGRDDIISLVYPANAASIRVAERLGERLRGTTEIFGREALLYGIDRATWRARTA